METLNEAAALAPPGASAGASLTAGPEATGEVAGETVGATGAGGDSMGDSVGEVEASGVGEGGDECLGAGEDVGGEADDFGGLVVDEGGVAEALGEGVAGEAFGAAVGEVEGASAPKAVVASKAKTKKKATLEDIVDDFEFSYFFSWKIET